MPSYYPAPPLGNTDEELRTDWLRKRTHWRKYRNDALSGEHARQMAVDDFHHFHVRGRSEYARVQGLRSIAGLPSRSAIVVPTFPTIIAAATNEDDEEGDEEHVGDREEEEEIQNYGTGAPSTVPSLHQKYRNLEHPRINTVLPPRERTAGIPANIYGRGALASPSALPSHAQDPFGGVEDDDNDDQDGDDEDELERLMLEAMVEDDEEGGKELGRDVDVTGADATLDGPFN
jgi:hypothetical protein